MRYFKIKLRDKTIYFTDATRKRYKKYSNYTYSVKRIEGWMQTVFWKELKNAKKLTNKEVKLLKAKML